MRRRHANQTSRGRQDRHPSKESLSTLQQPEPQPEPPQPARGRRAGSCCAPRLWHEKMGEERGLIRRKIKRYDVAVIVDRQAAAIGRAWVNPQRRECWPVTGKPGIPARVKNMGVWNERTIRHHRTLGPMAKMEGCDRSTGPDRRARTPSGRIGSPSVGEAGETKRATLPDLRRADENNEGSERPDVWGTWGSVAYPRVPVRAHRNPTKPAAGLRHRSLMPLPPDGRGQSWRYKSRQIGLPGRGQR